MDRDFFSFFGIEPKLALDPDSLQKRFYELSRRWHPDRFATRPAPDRQLALDNTALLNDAFRTLKEPVSRAEYVLSRHGLDIGEQGAKNVPPELLEEVFELNMAIDELKDGDASVRPQLETARASFQAMLASMDAALDADFRRWDEGQPRAALEAIRATLNRRKYIANLVRTVDQALGV